MQYSTLSSQGQTTIPAPVRKYLQLKPEQPITWELRENDAGVKYVTVSTSSQSVISSLRGIAKREYKKYGGGKKYLQKERNSWK